MSSDMITPAYCFKNAFEVSFPSREETGLFSKRLPLLVHGWIKKYQLSGLWHCFLPEKPNHSHWELIHQFSRQKSSVYPDVARNLLISIFSDCEGLLKAVSSFKIRLALVLIECNKTADRLTRLVAAKKFTGPESSLKVASSFQKNLIMEWMQATFKKTGNHFNFANQSARKTPNFSWVSVQDTWERGTVSYSIHIYLHRIGLRPNPFCHNIIWSPNTF